MVAMLQYITDTHVGIQTAILNPNVYIYIISYVQYSNINKKIMHLLFVYNANTHIQKIQM